MSRMAVKVSDPEQNETSPAVTSLTAMSAILLT